MRSKLFRQVHHVHLPFVTTLFLSCTEKGAIASLGTEVNMLHSAFQSQPLGMPPAKSAGSSVENKSALPIDNAPLWVFLRETQHDVPQLPGSTPDSLGPPTCLPWAPRPESSVRHFFHSVSFFGVVLSGICSPWQAAHKSQQVRH